MQMVMTSDETQIQIFAHWPMSHVKHETRDNRKNPEYHVASAIRELRTDTNFPPDPTYTGSIFVCGPLHHFLLNLIITVVIVPTFMIRLIFRHSVFKDSGDFPSFRLFRISGDCPPFRNFVS